MAARTAVVSADSHVLEPPDLWTRRLPTPHRARAPRMVESPTTGAVFVGPGIRPTSMLDTSTPGGSLRGEQLTLRTLRTGGFDAAARLADCDTDGVDAEILYPTAGMFVFGMADGELRRACMSVYNDWLGELCAEAPTRLFPLALLDVEDPTFAADELARRLSDGFVGAIIAGAPPEGHYGEERFDPLWRAAGSVPLAIHAFTDRAEQDTVNVVTAHVDVMAQIHRMQRTLAGLSVSVLQRHPELRLVVSEYDAGWVPHFLERLDRLVDRRRKGDLVERPSECIRRQVSFGFQRDEAAIEARHAIGVNKLLWGSDYPHVSSYWPHSMKVLDELLDGVPAEERAAIVGGNAIELYRLGAAAPQQ